MTQGELFPRPAPIAAYVNHWAPILGRLATEHQARELAELEAAELAERDIKPDNYPFIPGDLVRFTAAALRSMYGGRPLTPVKAPDKRFTVAPCACGMCAPWQWVLLWGRGHVARAALERVPSPPAGCVRREDREAVRAEQRMQLGVWQDDHGVWWVRAPR